MVSLVTVHICSVVHVVVCIRMFSCFLPVFPIVCSCVLAFINECVHVKMYVCVQPLSGDPVCSALISLIHRQHMDRVAEKERGVWMAEERGGRGDSLCSFHLLLLLLLLHHPHPPSILALGSVSNWPGHCKTQREEETISEMATCAVGGQLNHFQGDSAFKQ